MSSRGLRAGWPGRARGARGTERSVTRPRAVGLLLRAALAGLVVYTANAAFGIGALEGVGADLLYNALLALAAICCLARGVLVPAERGAWLSLGLGLAASLAAEIHFALYLADLDPTPFPTIEDALFLSFYAASYVALILLVRTRVRQFHASLWLDGLIGALATAALGSALAWGPIVAAIEGSPVAIAVNLAYPLADLLLLALVVWALALTGWRPGRSLALLGMAFFTVTVADGLFLYQSAVGTASEGTMLDALWPASALLIAYAAWQPPPRPRRSSLESVRVLFMPLAFALAALGLLFYGQSGQLNRLSLVLVSAALAAVLLRMTLAFNESLSVLGRSRRDALTDQLTGLGNRRKLMEDLDDALATATPQAPVALLVLDLDGFKGYNDSFGHPAGDALLARLGGNFAATVERHGRSYRLGGDEFCALLAVRAAEIEPIATACASALSEQGEAFSIGASYGAALIPEEADDAAEALKIADQRLYAQKRRRTRSAAMKETGDALIQALRERHPELDEHVDGVGDLTRAVARRLGRSPEEIDEVARAAELRDVGKMAVPESILNKPDVLDDGEWALMRQHTVAGERILAAAPALLPVAKLVRASTERYDGKGYPDATAGEEIPLGARIIAVCDAFHAMTTTRSHRPALPVEEALTELRRCAGTQFDPLIVDILVEVVASPQELPAREGEPSASSLL